MAVVCLTPLYGDFEAKAIVARLLEDKYGVTARDRMLRGDKNISEKHWDRDMSRLCDWVPVQYITGVQEFFGRTFAVEPGVLIPRVETEELVSMLVRRFAGRSGMRVLDVGTGSGAIAVTLALELPEVQVEAWELLSGTLQVARENAERLGAEVRFGLHDALTERPEQEYDLIVSNPPYVCESEAEQMRENVTRYEPAEALYVPDGDPLRFYRAIAAMPAREIWFEINERFGTQVRQLLVEKGFEATLLQDLHGRDRFVYGVR